MKKNNKGFTLAELLIVVAIIAVLVAVSIPIFVGQLDNAKKSTDEANERAGKAAAIAYELSETATSITHPATYYYDANKGVVVANAANAKETNIEPYGKMSGREKSIVKIVIGTDSNPNLVTVDWEASKD